MKYAKLLIEKAHKSEVDFYHVNVHGMLTLVASSTDTYVFT